ncbi:amidohydrolase [Sediminitomix flava]|nr:amidohydrolase family protein [Sediminitomix flava]
MNIRSTIFILFIYLFSCQRENANQQIPTIYVASKVISMDDNLTISDAIAIEEDRIIDISSLKTLKERYPNALVNYSLEGKTILPGFIDNHINLSLAGLILPMQLISPFHWELPDNINQGVTSQKQYRNALSELISSKNVNGEWVLTWGYHPYYHGDISRKILDKMSPEKPVVVVHHTLRSIHLNSKALELLQFEGKNLEEHPNIKWKKGYFYNHGFELVINKLGNLLTNEEYITNSFHIAKQQIHRSGITTFTHSGLGLFNTVNEVGYTKLALETADTPFRTYLLVNGKKLYDEVGSHVKAEFIIDSLANLGGNKVRMFPRKIKFPTDGFFLSYEMKLKNPIQTNIDQWEMPPGELEIAIRHYWKKNYQIIVDANGDLAIEEVLKLFRKINQEYPKHDHRFSIHDITYITPNLIEKIKDENVYVSLAPYHLYTSEQYTIELADSNRIQNLNRIKSFFDEKINTSFYSQYVIGPPSPLFQSWIATNRIDFKGQLRTPSQKIHLLDALKAVTINAAKELELDHEIGSLKPGKKADLTILEEDPFDVKLTKIKDIKVWGTMLDGKLYPIQD